MDRRFPWWIPALAVLLVPVLMFSGKGPAKGNGVLQGPLLEGMAPLDSLLLSAGGRPVVLNFWATWCSPCVHELPILDSLYIHREGQAVFAAVSIGDPSPASLVSFREGFTVSMPMVWLSPGEAETIRERLQIPPVLPVTLFLVGGEETSRAVGARPGSVLGAMLDGAVPEEVVADQAPSVHIFVVGSPSDPMTGLLHEAALSLAGRGSVDLLDPGTLRGREIIEENHLPLMERPYAQACVGPACLTPVFSPGDLAGSLAGFD